MVEVDPRIGCPTALAYSSYVTYLYVRRVIRLLIGFSQQQLYTYALSSSTIIFATLISFAGLGAAWGGMLVFDTMVFTLTLYKAITIRRSSVSFLTILFRDGKSSFFPSVPFESHIHITGAAYWAFVVLLTFYPKILTHASFQSV